MEVVLNPFMLLGVALIGVFLWGVRTAIVRRHAVLVEDGGRRGSFAHPSPGDRSRIRRAAAWLSGLVAVLYLVLAVVVFLAEWEANTPNDSTWGGYVMLAVPFGAGAVLLAIVDLRPFWALGALVQIAVIALFVWLALAPWGGPDEHEGVFDSEALANVAMAWWAVVITGMQVVLLLLLSYLALTPAEPGSTEVPESNPQELGR